MHAAKLLLSTIIYVCTASTLQAQSLPEGEGKQIVADICGQCHQLRFVTDARHTREQWVYIVSMMMTMGASVPGDKLVTVVDYLAKNFGREEGSSAGSATGEK